MSEIPYSSEPSPGLTKYNVTAVLKDYLEQLENNPEKDAHIREVFNRINDYTNQLKQISAINAAGTVQEVNNAIDNFFESAPVENKNDISCKAGCTACCYIELDVSGLEAALIVEYCKENSIAIDREYLKKQAANGRSSYSEVSRCEFLKEDLCSIYPVRPVACRKHFVKTDPILCNSAKNLSSTIAKYFDINTEILASALLNADEPKKFGKAILEQLNRIEV